MREVLHVFFFFLVKLERSSAEKELGKRVLEDWGEWKRCEIVFLQSRKLNLQLIYRGWLSE